MQRPPRHATRESDRRGRRGINGRHARASPCNDRVAKGVSSELPAYTLRRVTQYIQENLRRDLRLVELSALVHMSPYHFARLFKRSTGVPPHRFLVRRRIDEARALLAARTVPVAEVAQLVGFRTPSHFRLPSHDEFHRSGHDPRWARERPAESYRPQSSVASIRARPTPPRSGDGAA